MRAEATPIAPGFHVVATPIGNLGDVSFRALSTLAAATAVLAEDTRVTKTLLAHYGITTPLVPYHEHNAEEMRPQACSPGWPRGRRWRSSPMPERRSSPIPVSSSSERPWRPGHPVSDRAGRRPPCLPRWWWPACRPTASSSRVSCRRVPRPAASGWRSLRDIPGTLVFFESARRVAEMLADAAAVLGDRPAAVARELTKMFETVRRGTVDPLASRLRAANRTRRARSSC